MLINASYTKPFAGSPGVVRRFTTAEKVPEAGVHCRVRHQEVSLEEVGVNRAR